MFLIEMLEVTVVILVKGYQGRRF